MNDDPTFDVLLKRLERLTKAFLGAHFSGKRSLWDFQVDLYELQRDIQAEISNRESRTDSARLRELRWHARRLGDALIFVVFGMDKRSFMPLSRNSPTPIPSAVDDGVRGLLAAAAALSSQGWGHPVLHDITHLLRLGDVSFVKFRSDGSRECRTVEVKSHVADRSGPDASGGVTATYNVNAMWIPSADELAEMKAAGQQQAVPSVTTPLRRNPRAERQMKRLEAARGHIERPDHVIVQHDGKPLMSVTATISGRTHAEAVRGALRRARRTGVGWVAVDEAILYVALYGNDDLSRDEINDRLRHIVKPILDSGIWSTQRTLPSSFHFYGVPVADKHVQSYMPYFLYPFPKQTILDMLCGRMVIAALVNHAAFASALEREGYEVRPGPGAERGQCFIATWDHEDADGNQYQFELQNFDSEIVNSVLEFRTIDDFVATINAMRAAGAVGAEHFAKSAPN